MNDKSELVKFYNIELPLAVYDMDVWLKQTRSDDEILTAFGQVVSSVRALHRMNIAHLDIKPPNILYREERFVLSDFDISIMTVDKKFCSHVKVTEPYRAFEDNSNGVYGFDSDIWSLGALLAEMFVGSFKILQEPKDSYELEQKRVNQILRYVNYRVNNPQILDLLKKMLSINRSSRPTIEEVAAHPAIREKVALYPDQQLVLPVQKPVSNSRELREIVTSQLKFYSQKEPRICASTVFIAIDTFYRYVDYRAVDIAVDPELFRQCLIISSWMTGDDFEPTVNPERDDRYFQDIAMKLEFYSYCPLYFAAARLSKAHVEFALRIISNVDDYYSYDIGELSNIPPIGLPGEYYLDEVYKY